MCAAKLAGCTPGLSFSSYWDPFKIKDHFNKRKSLNIQTFCAVYVHFKLQGKIKMFGSFSCNSNKRKTPIKTAAPKYPSFSAVTLHITGVLFNVQTFETYSIHEFTRGARFNSKRESFRCIVLPSNYQPAFLECVKVVRKTGIKFSSLEPIVLYGFKSRASHIFGCLQHIQS